MIFAPGIAIPTYSYDRLFFYYVLLQYTCVVRVPQVTWYFAGNNNSSIIRVKVLLIHTLQQYIWSTIETAGEVECKPTRSLATNAICLSFFTFVLYEHIATTLTSWMNKIAGTTKKHLICCSRSTARFDRFVTEQSPCTPDANTHSNINCSSTAKEADFYNFIADVFHVNLVYGKKKSDEALSNMFTPTLVRMIT